MTGCRQVPSTYDRMLAEIVMDDDSDDADGCTTTSIRNGPAATPPTACKAEAKISEKRIDAGSNSMYQTQKEKSGDDMGGYRSTFPLAPRKYSSHRGSRCQSEQKKGSDSDDSDEGKEEKEAHVRHRDVDGFNERDGKATSREFSTDGNALRAFVMRAPKQNAPTMRCYVQRDRRGINRLNPVYCLFLEADKQFLLRAQKRPSSKTSNYLVSLSKTPTDRRSALNVAKLRANWSGSEYVIFDHGLSPSKTALDGSVRNILGIIEFAYDDMGPGRMNARIPNVADGGKSTKWKDPGISNDESSRKTAESKLNESALILRNKRPVYDAASGGHVLDFQGRVTMPSIKNFQLQCDTHGDATILQFGRVSCQPPGPLQQCKCHKDTFTLDLKHPLSPLQAFAVCLATLDSKVVDAQAFETISSLLRKLSS